MAGEVDVFEAQKDGSLSLTERIKVDRMLDNIAVAADGAVYAGGE